MNVRACFAVFGVLAAMAVSGCGGRSSENLASTIPQPPGGTPAASQSAARTYTLAGTARSYALPSVGGFSGSLALGAASVPAQTSMQLTSSLAAPPGVPLPRTVERRMQATGTLDVYFYTTILLSNTVTYPVPPGFSVTLPTTVHLGGLAFYYAISNPTPSNGAMVQYRTEGPATVSGQTVTFAPSTTPLTLLAGERYTIALYALTASTPTVLTGKIYVANFGSAPSVPNSVTSYNADGSRSTPTITAGLDYPDGVAVDAAGKIYVTNAGGDSLTTYDADGSQTSPTIVSSLDNPLGLAVDATGKIYVANANNNTVTTYGADGTQSVPSITAGLHTPEGVAVDATGKIYVSSVFNNTVTTYTAEGGTSAPTIVDGLNGPAGIAIDAKGKIYVANAFNSTITTYDAAGRRTAPTISAGLSAPDFVAVDAAGKIYVSNYGNNTVTTYDADGTQTTPTITAGLDGPEGIAVH